jgi:hypothetical protein
MAAFITGAHHISRQNPSLAAQIAKDIQTSGLLCGYGTGGYGAYAYYADRIPKKYFKAPFVVFRIEDVRVRSCPGFGGLEYFMIPEGDKTKFYASINIIGYINLTGFVSCSRDLYNFL